jgi:L-lactate dehydrogenase complex protein LldG
MESKESPVTNHQLPITSNPSRSRILDRVKAAMKQQAPRMELHGEPKPWFSEVPRDAETMIGRFQQELEMLKGEFLRAANAEDASRKLRDFFAGNHIKRIAASDEPLLRQLLLGTDARWIGPQSEAGASLEGFDIGITRADALAAGTGTILLTSRSGSGRALSVLPPIHLVVAKKEELVADLAEGIQTWQGKYGANWPSNVYLITGPSRTADIEKILVLGAHGPKRLVTLLLG